MSSESTSRCSRPVSRIGLADAQLLASVVQDVGSPRWTRDRRLVDAARHLGITHR